MAELVDAGASKAPALTGVSVRVRVSLPQSESPVFNPNDKVIIVKDLWSGTDVLRALFAEAPEHAPHLCGVNEMDSKGKKYREYVTPYDGRFVLHDTPEVREQLAQWHGMLADIAKRRTANYDRMKSMSAVPGVADPVAIGDRVFRVNSLTHPLPTRTAELVYVRPSEPDSEIAYVCAWTAGIRYDGCDYVESAYANYIIPDKVEVMAVLNALVQDDVKLTQEASEVFNAVYAISADRCYNP